MQELSQKQLDKKKAVLKRTEGVSTTSELLHEVTHEHTVVENIPNKSDNVRETKKTVERKTLTFKQVQWTECIKQLTETSEYIQECRQVMLKDFRQNCSKTHLSDQTNSDGEHLVCPQNFLIMRAFLKKRCENFKAKRAAFFSVHPGMADDAREKRLNLNKAILLENDKFLAEMVEREKLEACLVDCEKASKDQDGLTTETLENLRNGGNLIAGDLLSVLTKLESVGAKGDLYSTFDEHIAQIIEFHLPKDLELSASTSDSIDGKYDHLELDIEGILKGDIPMSNEFVGFYIHQIVPMLDENALKDMLRRCDSVKTKFRGLIYDYFDRSGTYLRKSDIHNIVNSFARSVVNQLRDGNFDDVCRAWQKFTITWALVGQYFFCHSISRDNKSVDVKIGRFDFISRADEIDTNWKTYMRSSEIHACAEQMAIVYSKKNAFHLNGVQLKFHMNLFPTNLRGDEKSCFLAK